MTFRRHGNSYNDHVTSTYKGKLGEGKIYRVLRGNKKTQTKRPLPTDIILEYIENNGEGWKKND